MSGGISCGRGLRRAGDPSRRMAASGHSRLQSVHFAGDWRSNIIDAMTDGNGHLSPLGKAAIYVLTGLAMTGIGAAMSILWQQNATLARMEETLAKVASEASTALTQAGIAVEVKQQHGDEFLSVRDELKQIRTQIDVHTKVMQGTVDTLSTSVDSRLDAIEFALEKQITRETKSD